MTPLSRLMTGEAAVTRPDEGIDKTSDQHPILVVAEHHNRLQPARLLP